MSERAKTGLTYQPKSESNQLTKLNLFVLLFIVGLVTSCSSAPDQFGKLDLKKWRGDRGGCTNIRTALIPDLKAEVQQLKGKSANEIGELLGRPDLNQLVDRNQKFYIYFLEEGIHCNQPATKSTSRSVAIRMSAIGLATEITFQNGIP